MSTQGNNDSHVGKVVKNDKVDETPDQTFPGQTLPNQTLEDTSAEANSFDKTAKAVDQVVDTAGKWAGYFTGYCVRIYNDTKDSVSKVSGADFGRLRGVDFSFLSRRNRQSDQDSGTEGHSAEFYENLGRDIFEMAKSAKTNENLTIISTAKYR